MVKMNEQKTIMLMLIVLCIVLLFATMFLFASNLNMQRQVVQINNKAYHMQQGMLRYASDNNFDMNGYFQIPKNIEYIKVGDMNIIIKEREWIYAKNS